MLEELLSLIRSGDAGWSETGAKLKKESSAERFALEDLFNQFKETQSVAGAKDISRKRRKSKGRLIGSLLGAGGTALATFLTGGAITPLLLAGGAGAGSLAGSKYSMATQPGGWRLAQSKANIPTGMFFKGTRGKAGIQQRDINRMISEANRTFDQAQYADALTDAWSAYKIANLPKAGKSLWDFGRGKGQILPDLWDNVEEVERMV
tara:strand:- start:77 stop:697 length:621 start_codon:yes stop_codon:yes gene_type:complete